MNRADCLCDNMIGGEHLYLYVNESQEKLYFTAHSKLLTP